MPTNTALTAVTIGQAAGFLAWSLPTRMTASAGGAFAVLKSILGLAGAMGGGALAHFFIHSPDPLWNFIWYDTPAALMGGSIGLLMGMMLDVGKIYWKCIAGVLGMPVGAGIGFEVARRLMYESFAGGAYAGMFIGIPVGAMLGCVSGFVLGSYLARE